MRSFSYKKKKGVLFFSVLRYNTEKQRSAERCVFMNFLNKVGKTLGEAAHYVGEKNRRAAQLSRIRTVIQCEQRAAEKQYLALGRYYYNNLRDEENAVTEAHCVELEGIETRLDAALQLLEKFYAGQEEEIPPCFEEEENREEVTLEDVVGYDRDPLGDDTVLVVESPSEALGEEAAVSPQEAVAPAGEDENDELPFEG